MYVEAIIPEMAAINSLRKKEINKQGSQQKQAREKEKRTREGKQRTEFAVLVDWLRENNHLGPPVSMCQGHMRAKQQALLSAKPNEAKSKLHKNVVTIF